MRLLCTVAVSNRFLSKNSMKQSLKHVKSTLAICKHPKNSEYHLILFTAQNKSGTKYNINGNISCVLTRFLSEGKATIQFKAPEVDLYIKAQVIELKNFLVLLKKALENKLSEKENTISAMGVTAINAKEVAPKKLIIKKRSEYPVKGLPRTLEILHINEIKQCTLNVGILKLSRLRVLDLSHNLIEFLPEELNKLPCLAELNLSDNQMGKSAPRKWDWMGGRLIKSLKLLNLRNNNLSFLPDQLIRLFNLVSLHVDKNELTVLPSGIGNLINLRVLSLSNNNLKGLPGSSRKWKLDDLDLSYNRFHERGAINPAAICSKALPVCTLKEYAAKVVLKSRIFYTRDILPFTLIKYLELAKYCVCGKACFEIFICTEVTLFLTAVSKNIMSTQMRGPFVPMDCYCCSFTCYNSAYYSRGRNPVI